MKNQAIREMSRKSENSVKEAVLKFVSKNFPGKQGSLNLADLFWEVKGTDAVQDRATCWSFMWNPVK